MKKVHLVTDLQYGSTGKGLIAGYLAESELKPDVVINANMPNAGHTYIDGVGRKWVHKVLPNGIVSPNLKAVMIGPGSVFNFDRLVEEINESSDLLQGVPVFIHASAVVLGNDDASKEKALVSAIGSTGQGSAAAMVRKIERNSQDLVVARDILPSSMNLNGVTVNVIGSSIWQHYLRMANCILAEAAQGYSLGISQSQFYPFTTSRDCTPARFMSDMAIPLPMLKEVIGTCRTYPIRVAGNSGGYYSDQREIVWSDISQEPELTTVTKKVRRLFTFSHAQLKDACNECMPNRIFLNFVNYLSPEHVDSMVMAVSDIAINANPESKGVTWIGVGPTSEDVVSIL
jgi:adenylosuccinate synthase